MTARKDGRSATAARSDRSGFARAAKIGLRANFAQELKIGLQKTGMTFRQAADLFRTAPGTVSRWANGFSAPPFVAQKAILRALRKHRSTKRKTPIARHRLPMAPAEMRVLLALHRGGEQTVDDLEYVARVDRGTLYVVLQRLRKSKLIVTQKDESEGTLHRVTVSGYYLAAAWDTFLDSIGPTLKKTIGWIELKLY